MSNVYDVCVIGAGVAGAFAGFRLTAKHKNCKTLLIELSAKPAKRRSSACGWLGLFPTGDGKLYLNNLDQVKEIVDGRRANSASKFVMDLLEQAGPLKITKDVFPSVATQKKIKEHNFDLQLNNYISWAPCYVHSLSRIMAEKMEANPNLTWSFDNEVYTVHKKKNHFIITTELGEFQAKKVILSVGRSGWRWANEFYQSLGLITSDDVAKFGIRIEMGAQYLKDFNKSHCTLIREDLTLGPFSWNGTVIPEDHSDLVISAFRSNEDRWKTDKVSFSLLGHRSFPNEGCSQTERLGKLIYVLNNDRVGKERIKTLFKKESQLSLLPEYDWLLNCLTELEKIMPNLITRGYFHTPNILPLPAPINIAPNLETEVEGLFVAGETTGISGILSACLMGTVAADSIV